VYGYARAGSGGTRLAGALDGRVHAEEQRHRRARGGGGARDAVQQQRQQQEALHNELPPVTLERGPENAVVVGVEGGCV
jgi:hypothetical protein